MKIYLVGGYVRDTLMGIKPKDRDYVVVGSTPEEMVSLGYSQVGANFPVFLHPETDDEYALARIDRKVGIGYHGFTSEFNSSVTLEEDLARRDLTINAMALPADDPRIENLVDPFNGRLDLRLGLLRHVSEAFREDPVRILRVARFVARYNFHMHSDTLKFMTEMVINGEFDNLVGERVWAEVAKGLMEMYPLRMFETLEKCGALQRIVAYTGGLDGGGMYRPDPYHNTMPLRQRFACIGQYFGKTADLYDQHKIPLDCKRLSMVMNNNNDTGCVYLTLPPNEKLDFLTRIGAIGSLRNTSLFEDFKVCHDLWCRSRLVDCRPCRLKQIDMDAKALQTLNFVEIMSTSPPQTSKEMVHHFKQHQLAILERNAHANAN